MMKRTPLFIAHQRAGAKLIEFGGWEMPVYYTSIGDEHRAVRSAAGVFDIAHMGEVRVDGSGALEFLNHVLTNDAGKIRAGQGQYTLMCNERGGVIDDLYLYRLAGEEFLLIVNASRIEADYAWLEEQRAKWPKPQGLKLRNSSGELGALAVQGPVSAQVADGLFEGGAQGGTIVSRPSALKKNELGTFAFGGELLQVARTGYTGEVGFEVVAPGRLLEGLWERILETGGSVGLKPAGLGARDTLRTEACYPLYGHELSEVITPIEAGLGFFVALDKGEFIGRDALVTQKEAGPGRRLAAFKMMERSAPPRAGYGIWRGEERVGEVTSGTQSPSLNVGIGLGYVLAGLAKAETRLEVEIRGRKAPAMVVPKPIYRKLN